MIGRIHIDQRFADRHIRKRFAIVDAIGIDFLIIAEDLDQDIISDLETAVDEVFIRDRSP